MEVAIPVPASDFDFSSTCSSPYISAPSSPKRFGEFFYYSAPTSPRYSSSIYNEFTTLSIDNTTTPSVIPFNWEDKPGKPKSNQTLDGDYNFEFNFSGPLIKTPLTTAEELFEKGKIRPLKPPPRLQVEEFISARNSAVSSPKSPKSPKFHIFGRAFSPREKKEFDPFEAAMEEIERGRDKRSTSDISNPTRRSSRSLSPYRVSNFDCEEQENNKQESTKKAQITPPLKGNSKKWKLKDFLLFRSASEGSSTDKDPLRKYRMLSKKTEDVKNSSFRSTDSSGSVSGSSRGRKGPVSAHELHYTANRAVSEGLKKKTFLPYRQGLLGCLGFNPTVHGLAKGFNNVTRV
ncbi:uncharacterized protein LOC143848251 [Tasmannia lanceolata]|uniref:uncharacterized protein LOC143848251 n=1 Tax=Tasmannia lanceolata TaxID=3420 RepID=UPI004062F264